MRLFIGNIKRLSHHIKRTSLITIITLCLIFTKCGTYLPTYVNDPANINVANNNSDLNLSCTVVPIKIDISANQRIYKNAYISFDAFRPLMNRNLINLGLRYSSKYFDLLGGCGYAKIKNTFTINTDFWSAGNPSYTHLINVKYIRYFVQPSFIYQISDNQWTIFTLRYNYLDYGEYYYKYYKNWWVDEDDFYADEYQDSQFMKDYNNFRPYIVDIFGTYKHRFNKLSFYFQLGITFNENKFINYTNSDIDPYYFPIQLLAGLNYSIKYRKSRILENED